MAETDIPHITEGDVACSCNPLVLTIAPDGSISRISGGPLEEPISTAAPDPVASPLFDALVRVYKTAADVRASVEHVHQGADCPVIGLDGALADVLRLDPDDRLRDGAVASPAPLDPMTLIEMLYEEVRRLDELSDPDGSLAEALSFRRAGVKFSIGKVKSWAATPSKMAGVGQPVADEPRP